GRGPAGRRADGAVRGGRGPGTSGGTGVLCGRCRSGGAAATARPGVRRIGDQAQVRPGPGGFGAGAVRAGRVTDGAPARVVAAGLGDPAGARSRPGAGTAAARTGTGAVGAGTGGVAAVVSRAGG